MTKSIPSTRNEFPVQPQPPFLPPIDRIRTLAKQRKSSLANQDRAPNAMENSQQTNNMQIFRGLLSAAKLLLVSILLANFLVSKLLAQQGLNSVQDGNVSNPNLTENAYRDSMVAQPQPTSERLSTKIESNVSSINPNDRSVDPNQLVLESIQNSVWGPSYACSVRQRTELDGQTTLGTGEYWHGGQGSGQFKFTLRTSVNESVSNLVQSCDGRGMHTMFGTSQVLKSLNLDRIRQSLNGMRRDRDDRAQLSLYMAVGGHPEILRMLYHRYRWTKAFAGVIEGKKVWQLLGTLRTEPPVLRASATVDQIALRKDPPPLMPTEVRLTLHRDPAIFLIPMRIEYFRQIKNDQDEQMLKPFSSIEYLRLQSPVRISEDLFRYVGQENAEQIVDETKLYMPPMSPAGKLTSGQ